MNFIHRCAKPRRNLHRYSDNSDSDPQATVTSYNNSLPDLPSAVEEEKTPEPRKAKKTRQKNGAKIANSPNNENLPRKILKRKVTKNKNSVVFNNNNNELNNNKIYDSNVNNNSWFGYGNALSGKAR